MANPLTKTEKAQIKELANTQYNISKRYEYEHDPVKSSFYYGRSVRMGKVARAYNPIVAIKRPTEYKIVRYGVYEPYYLKQKSPRTGKWEIAFSHNDLGFIYSWLRSWGIDPHKVKVQGVFPPTRNPLLEGAITGLGFGAGLAASGMAVKKMLGDKIMNPVGGSINPAKHKCPICGKPLKYVGIFKGHHRYKCPYCKTYFLSVIKWDNPTRR